MIVCETLGFRGTPVEKRWSRGSSFGSLQNHKKSDGQPKLNMADILRLQWLSIRWLADVQTVLLREVPIKKQFALYESFPVDSNS